MKYLNVVLIVLLTFCLSTDVAAQKKGKKGAGKKAAKKEVVKEEAVVKEVKEIVEEYTIPSYEVKSTTVDGQEGFSILLEKVDLKTVSKLWKKKLKKSKGELEGESANLSVVGGNFSAINSNPLDVVSTMKVVGAGVELFAGFNTEEGPITAADHPDQAQAIDEMLNDFALVFEKKRLEDAYGAEKKMLNGLESDMKKLVRKKESLESEIEKCKRIIADSEHNIEENLKEQERKKAEVAAQKVAVTKSKNKVDLYK